MTETVADGIYTRARTHKSDQGEVFRRENGQWLMWAYEDGWERLWLSDKFWDTRVEKFELVKIGELPVGSFIKESC